MLPPRPAPAAAGSGGTTAPAATAAADAARSSSKASSSGAAPSRPSGASPSLPGRPASGNECRTSGHMSAVLLNQSFETHLQSTSCAAQHLQCVGPSWALPAAELSTALSLSISSIQLLPAFLGLGPNLPQRPAPPAAARSGSGAGPAATPAAAAAAPSNPAPAQAPAAPEEPEETRELRRRVQVCQNTLRLPLGCPRSCCLVTTAMACTPHSAGAAPSIHAD